MTNPKTAPYGSWKSPITSDLIVSEIIGLGNIALDGDDIYWIEMRPAENGRYVLVKRTPDGHITDITPPPFNVRTRVHEYGGGAYSVADGTVYFSNFADQQLYRKDPESEPYPITPRNAMRYADGVVDHLRNCLICVREDHSNPKKEAVNTIVSVSLEGGDADHILGSGNDFYSSPRLSPNGSFLAWLTWNHPNMPWDGTELWVGKIKEGSLENCERIAGGPNESIFQPEWSPDGTLHFVSDRTGWWNICRWLEGRIEPVCAMEAEFGVPQWLFGMSTYAFESKTRIICTYTQKGTWHLASLDITTGELHLIESPYSLIEYVRAAPGRVVFKAGSPTELPSIVMVDPDAETFDVLRRSSNITINPGYVSVPEAVEFPTENGLTAHGFFYAPKNRDFRGPHNENPPLLVMSHGGPTDADTNMLNPKTQYWASRGIAVLDVNYGGSSGYGRDYRQRLKGQWGIVDVDDCVNGAKYLVECGKVDGDRLAIRGGSAGGYTTLSVLTFRSTFKAGASHFGVSDLEALAKETHKFESHYLDTLVGPYPACQNLYRERSPIYHTEQLSCPVIFFQGLDDKVVLPNQAEKMVNVLKEKGLPVAYIPFEGEQHGFRRAETIKRALDGELYFYAQIFGFELADTVEPVYNENL